MFFKLCKVNSSDDGKKKEETVMMFGRKNQQSVGNLKVTKKKFCTAVTQR